MVKFLLLFSFKQEHHNRVGDAQKYAAAVTSDTLDDHGDTEDVAKDVADTGGSSEADALINISLHSCMRKGEGNVQATGTLTVIVRCIRPCCLCWGLVRASRAPDCTSLSAVMAHPRLVRWIRSWSPSASNRLCGWNSSRSGIWVTMKSHVFGGPSGASLPRMPVLRGGADSKGPLCPSRTIFKGGKPAEAGG